MPLQAPKVAEAAPKTDFNSHLKNALGEVNELQQKANQAIEQLVGEGKGDLQETIVAMERADVSFRLMMQIRNKVLEAYQEIMRMQV
jgi:flagellar hook-basal body complex protein FliE